MYNRQQISKYLINNLELSQIESQIYLDLLEHGTSTVLRIAERTEIKRPTVHRNVDGLISKGLATQVKIGQGNKRRITAEPPHKLKTILSQKRFELTQAEQELPNIIETVKSIVFKSENPTQSNVRYYEGKKNIRLLYKEILDVTKNLYSFVNVEEVLSVFPENARLFTESFDKNPEIEMWEIIEDSRISFKYTHGLNERYHYKVVPDNITFSNTDFMIFNDKVAMVTLNKEDPTAIVYKSKPMVDGLVAVHKMVWNILDSVN